MLWNLTSLAKKREAPIAPRTALLAQPMLHQEKKITQRESQNIGQYH
jgi:hypothetical protein